MNNNGKNQTVFIGAVVGYKNLSDAALAQSLLDSNIGLYGHGTAETIATQEGYMKDITSAMKVAQSGGSAAGIAELGFDYGLSYGNVVLQNNTNQAITINSSDITFKSNDGKVYILPGQTGNPSRESYQYSDYNSFTIPANGQLTVSVEASDFGSQYNISANQIVSINTSGNSISGISIVSSTAISGGIDNIEQNGSSILDPNSLGSIPTAWYAQGFPASEANVNVPNNYVMTNNDLQSWKYWVDNIRTSGIMNIGGIFNQISQSSFLSTKMDMNQFNSNTKDAIFYSGGIAIDMPAQFGLILNQGSYYLQNTMTEIKWAKSEGLRVSWIISPYGSGSTASTRDYDANMLAEVKQMVSILQANDAMPTQIVVENYTTDASGGVNVPDSNAVEGLDKIAEYVATLNLTPSNSEAGLQIAGQKAVDMMMSGIRPNISVKYGQTAFIYDDPYIFGKNSTQTISMTVSITTDGMTLSSQKGTVSNNGKTITYTGTEDELTTLIKSLQVTDGVALNSNQQAQLRITLSDSSGTITGTTNINYTGADSLNISIQNGVMQNTKTYNNNAVFLSYGGGLNVSGTANLTAVGSYNYINLATTGTNNNIALALSGDGILSNIAGKSGITLNNGSLSLYSSSAGVYAYSGNVFKYGANYMSLYGNVDYLYTEGDQDLSISLNKAGTINGATGNLGVTLVNGAYLNVTGSVVYVGLNSGNIDINHGWVNMRDDNPTGYSFVNVNDGTLVYSRTTAGTVSIFGNAGRETLGYNTGYTATYSNINNNFASIAGLTQSNGSIFATNIGSVSNMKSVYADGNVFIYEKNSNNGILLRDTSRASWYSSFGNEDFSKNIGSNSTIITRDQQANVQYTTGGSYNSDNTAYKIKGGNVTLGSVKNSSIEVDMTSGARVTLNGYANQDIFLTGFNASDLTYSHSSGNITMISSSTSSVTILNDTHGITMSSSYHGVATASITGQTSVFLG